MALEVKAKAAADKAGITTNIENWLISEGLVEMEDVALLAKLEEQVKANIIDIAVAASVKVTLKENVAITKYWTLCRAAYDNKNTPETAASSSDGPIPPDDAADVKKSWSVRHNIVLPDAYLAVESIQGKMWRDATATPPRVAVWLAESLRTRSCLDKKVGHLLSVVPGKVAETIGVVADNVTRPFELYLRIRCFFMTLSYVSILTPNWFPFQSATEASEMVLALIMTSYGKFSPPTNYLVTAWASTSHYLSEQVRMTGKSPREVMENTGGWEHRWKWTPPQDSANHGESLPQSTPGDQGLQQQLNEMKAKMKAMQSERDRAAAVALNASQEERPAKRFKNGKGGKQGKGKGGKR
jgi:hypothetical protein